MPEKKQEPMSLFMKIQTVKSKLLQANLKKSGKNSHAGFKYYELGDFLPAIVDLCKDYGLFTQVLFNEEFATLSIFNCDDPTQYVEYTSPMRDVELKGCQPIQALGAVETYQRRYLYLNAFDIVENDTLDAVAGDEKEKPKVFGDEDLERLKKKPEYLRKFKTSDDLINDVQKFYAELSREMKMKIADARAEIPDEN